MALAAPVGAPPPSLLQNQMQGSQMQGSPPPLISNPMQVPDMPGSERAGTCRRLLASRWSRPWPSRRACRRHRRRSRCLSPDPATCLAVASRQPSKVP
ncbi:hypothetical protein LP419_17870 [Massilia sp. H-1]|nr:hypothetical protein LP419_17870 [Massilia sp. H-1]